MSNAFLEISSSPLMNLDHTKRYSGTKLVEEETLSQHIMDTIMMGLKIIDKVNSISDHKLDPAKYVMKAVYHDLEEIITGDIPRPLKYYNDDTLRSMREVADDVARRFFSCQFVDSEYHYNLWDTSKSGDDEGYILKIVDTLVVAHKVIKEVSLLHNFYMLRVAHEVIQYLGGLYKKVQHEEIHLFEDDDVRTYILDILEGSIDIIGKLLHDNDDVIQQLRITEQSMI